jgi:hypothetical protein
MSRTIRTEEQLKQIATMLQAGQLFTDRHIREGEVDILPSVFMPLVFMTEEQTREMRQADVTLIFEEISKAGPRCINGYPMFTSFQSLTREEHKRVMFYYKRLDEALKAAVKDDYVQPEDPEEQSNVI